MTREGKNFSRSIHKNDKFLIVGLYPKRPKLSLTGDEFLVKINKKFFNGAKQAATINIPMIVGCPLVKNLWVLDETAKCIWIKLTDRTKDFYCIEYDDKKISNYKVL